MKKIISAILALGCVTVWGQELHESLRVEGQYIPDVIRQDKIRMLPTRLPLKTDLTPLAYETDGVTASYRPDFTALPARGWHTERRVPERRGYLDLSAGKFLDIVGSAGYRFIDTRETLLGFMAQHNSTSLFRPRTGGGDDGRYRYRYDETIGLYVSHIFAGAGTLRAEAGYHAGLFNYYGATGDFRPGIGRFPSQTLNDAYISAGWSSPADARLSWGANAYYRYFGYRAAYTLPDIHFKGTRESTAGVNGGVSYSFGNGSSAGADVKFDYAGYTDSSLDGYCNLTLTPRYRYSKAGLSLQAGLNLDITSGAGEKGNRYGTFHLSPAVNAGWRKGVAGLWLKAEGGTELQTLASLYERDYYQNPELTSTLPVFTPAHISAGVNVGPIAGLSAGVRIEYKYSKFLPAGGWYMSTLCPRLNLLPAIPGYSYDLTARGDGMDVKGISLGMNINCRPLEVFSLTGDLSWQPQSGDKGFFNGYDRPRWILSVRAEAEVVSGVKVIVGYQYRGVRHIYAVARADAGSGLPFTTADRIEGMRLPDVTDLSAGLSWALSDRFSIWGEALNILDRRVQLLPQTKSEGFGFLLGFGVKF